MEKTIVVDGKELTIRASAFLPRLYRSKFGRDLIRDMTALKDAFDAAQKEEDKKKAMMSVTDLTVFENVAYCMVVLGGNEGIPATAEEWLDSIQGTFSIYEILPSILEVWTDNLKTTSEPKKKVE